MKPAFGWARWGKPRRKGATLHARVLRVARAQPQAPALTFRGETLSYGELTGRAEALASGLRAHGIGRGSLVALHLERGFDMVAAVLGVLVAGAAYLPLDTSAPPLQLERVMAEAAPDLLLAGEGGPTSWRGPVPELRIAEARETRPAVAGGAEDFAPDDLAPDDLAPDELAYVIFTSGSTGRPKGVEITHGAILNLLDAAGRSPGFGARDTLVAVANLAFDVSVADLFLPLTTGGRLVLADREEQLDFRRLAALLEASGCTFMQATPTTWEGLVATGWAGSRRLRILSGADVLPPGLARALLRRGREVWNMYGPTEATVWCAQHRVGPADDPIPIGAAIEGLRIHVSGPDGRDAAAGEEGELLISGAGLSRGYRGAPELTAARFAPRPGSAAGERAYRSGDLGRRRRDGVLEWVGRLDSQVKVRGYRIELGDVEAALASHPGVAAAAVNAGAGQDGAASLTAYVLPRDPAAPPTPGELRRWVRERRPIYFVPARIAVVDAMPRTAGGKIDRARLRALAAFG